MELRDTMPKFAANISMMYNEVPFLDRPAAAARDGFKAVECMFPYAQPAEALAASLRAAGVELVLFNLPPGDFEKGERGLAALPGREKEFGAALETALAYAKILDCPRLHAMAGITTGLARGQCQATYIANLKHAVSRVAGLPLTLLIEPINGIDIPGYFINTQAQGHAVRQAVGAANLKVQMDLYHIQMGEGGIADKMRHYIDPAGANVGHIQIAGVPGRHEPDVGEINYPYLFDLLDTLGYAGWVGCEYRPKGETSQGLGWVRGRL